MSRGLSKSLNGEVKLSIQSRAVALCILLLGISLSGCSVQPTGVIPATIEGDGATTQMQQPKPPQGNLNKAYEPSARTNTSYLSPAAKELVAKAKRYSGSGDSASALRSLERAQRISPRAPQVYLAMAEVRLQQGDIRQARQLANKALSLVGDDDDLKQTAEQFLNGL
ncbi:tetratricopeptide repeat protein [Alkalimarinus alittae]|uniref:Tetratricopeptide repeat protein n=1 Tax=Alkalimarinus alittae TaxID=2961619 RepID=A0ABY6N175_9ALTE|nr:tetratricopeptide repeat protein [Alkalimarinus alittae]UZE95863.1 tetratricopeptide repeat protein [Alkalimarinus alittae]